MSQVTLRNRRRARRQGPAGTTRVRAYANALGLGPNVALAVLDLSETGARLLLKQEVPAGREIEVRLEGNSRSVKALARVVWSVPAADGSFCAGAEFAKPLAYAELSALARP